MAQNALDIETHGGSRITARVTDTGEVVLSLGSKDRAIPGHTAWLNDAEVIALLDWLHVRITSESALEDNSTRRGRATKPIHLTGEGKQYDPVDVRARAIELAMDYVARGFGDPCAGAIPQQVLAAAKTFEQFIIRREGL